MEHQLQRELKLVHLESPTPHPIFFKTGELKVFISHPKYRKWTGTVLQPLLQMHAHVHQTKGLACRSMLTGMTKMVGLII